jgi:hypothetical protein
LEGLDAGFKGFGILLAFDLKASNKQTPSTCTIMLFSSISEKSQIVLTSFDGSITGAELVNSGVSWPFKF